MSGDEDKEARIRELEREARLSRRLFVEAKDRGNKLEAALRGVVDQGGSLRAGGPYAEDALDLHDALDRAVEIADEALATSPPDSEPVGEVVVTKNEDGDAVAVTRQDEEGEILSVIWERDSESVEGEGGETCPVCEKGTLTRIECCICDNCDADPVLPDQIRRNDARLLSRIGSKPVQRQDAMLERREVLEAYIEDRVQWLYNAIGTCSQHPSFMPLEEDESLRECILLNGKKAMQQVADKALSRTSDEGTGSVVPEAEQSADWLAHYFCTHDVDEMCHVHLNRIRRNLSRAHVPDAVRSFPNDMRREAARLEDAPGDKWARARADVLRRRANELDRAIAEQGGQPEHGESDEL